MTNARRNGESINPLRAYQETNKVQPPFRLTEALVNDVSAWARAYGTDPSSFAEDLLRSGLKAKMFPSDAIVFSGPEGPISVRKIRTNAMVPDDGKHQEA